MSYQNVKSVLFVCMGNICRSPTAEAVFRQKAKSQHMSLEIDSAGTTGSHVKEKPDHRSQKAGVNRGYDFKGIRARKVTTEDFDKFDLVLAMDEYNVKDLMRVAPEDKQHKIKLFLEFAKNYDDMEVPDPYYGGARGFEYVLDLVEDASEGLLGQLK